MKDICILRYEGYVYIKGWRIYVYKGMKDKCIWRICVYEGMKDICILRDEGYIWIWSLEMKGWRDVYKV